MNDIEIYTLPSCPYCVKAKKLFQSLNLDYKEHDISENQEKMREELKNKFNSCNSAANYHQRALCRRIY